MLRPLFYVYQRAQLDNFLSYGIVRADGRTDKHTKTKKNIGLTFLAGMKKTDVMTKS